MGMRRFISMGLVLAMSATAWAKAPSAEEASTDSVAAKQRLAVAVREAPPFAFKDESGNWIGITVELWQAVAKTLGYKFDYHEYDLVGALESIYDGRADVGVGAFSITAKRVEKMKFTHTYASAGLGIATTRATGDPWRALFDRFFTWPFFRTVLILSAVLLVAGSLVWLFERKENSEHFSRRPIQGLGAGFWWSAVTMTTVGYGDKSPTTFGGRIVALIWMVTSIAIISVLTGSIAAGLTLVQIVPKVTGPQDLAAGSVGTVKDSTGDEYLSAHGIHPQYYENVKKGLEAVEAETVSAFVSDHAILSYWVAKDFAGKVDVLPQSFNPTFLALPLSSSSPNRHVIDLALLEFVETPAWNAILTKYSVIK